MWGLLLDVPLTVLNFCYIGHDGVFFKARRWQKWQWHVEKDTDLILEFKNNLILKMTGSFVSYF